MKRSRYVVILLAAVILIAGAARLLWRASLPQVRAGVLGGGDRHASGSSLQSNSVDQKLFDHTTNPLRIANSAATWSGGVATPIEFYGKVIDETGLPVSGANVSISVHDKVFQTGSEISKRTDESGNFDVSAHGLGLGISVAKDGYYATDRSVGSFGYAAGAGTGAPHRDPKNPATFVLRRRGPTEPLITFDKEFRFDADGAPVRVSLATGAQVTSDGDAIEIRLARSKNASAGTRRYDWQCFISVPAGGVIERKNNFAFEAPAGGYSRDASIEMPASLDRAWRSQIARDYFVSFSDGRFARVQLTISTGGDRFCSVMSYFNPSGSRNLEFDASKAIRPK